MRNQTSTAKRIVIELVVHASEDVKIK